MIPVNLLIDDHWEDMTKASKVVLSKFIFVVLF